MIDDAAIIRIQYSAKNVSFFTKTVSLTGIQIVSCILIMIWILNYTNTNEGIRRSGSGWIVETGTNKQIQMFSRSSMTRTNVENCFSISSMF